MEFEWDRQKAAANLAKHKVSFEDAAAVFGDPLGRIVADSRYSAEEERFVLLGLSQGMGLLAVMYVERGEAIRIVSARRATPRERKATGRADAGEILPEYDFSRASPNKYASRYAAGSAVVVLEPDVAAAFPSSKEANEALRALAGIILKHRSRRPALRRDL